MTYLEFFLDFFRWLPRYFFPKICFNCGAEGAWVCKKCRPLVKCLLSAPINLICPICQRLSFGGWTHSQCKNRYGLDRLISFYEYDGWAKKIIKNVKFGKSKIYRALTDLSAEFAFALKGDSLLGKVSPYEVSASGAVSVNDLRLANSQAVLIPVPLHWYRQFKRGFNQSSLIAKALGKGLNIPVNEKLLKRVRHTDPQTLVSSSLRLKNIRGCFSCLQGEASAPAVSNNDSRLTNSESVFLLVDDVWTTGVTLTECCRVLKRAGAKKVWALTPLRA